MAGEANITEKQFLDFAARIDRRMDKLELTRRKITPLVPVTIPTEGWETDNTYPKYPNCYDITIDGLLETDVVVMESLPESEDAARAASFMGTESYAGKVRLRAKNVPTAAIMAQYRIINTVPYVAQEEGQ